MNYIDFAQSISPEIIDEFYAKKTVLRLQRKAYRRKAAVGVSTAAALLAVMSAGLWLREGDGNGSEISASVLQNPSEDTPLPPVSEVSNEASASDIDWDFIRLNAVYDNGFRDENEQSDTEKNPCEVPFSKPRFTLNFTPEADEACSEGDEVYYAVCIEYEVKLPETSTGETKFDPLTDLGVTVFEREVTVCSSYDDAAEETTTAVTLYTAYVTETDIANMRKITEQTKGFRVRLILAPELLKDNTDTIYLTENDYFPFGKES